MQSRVYLVVIHWYEFGTQVHKFSTFHGAFYDAVEMTSSPHVAFATLKRVPYHMLNRREVIS